MRRLMLLALPFVLLVGQGGCSKRLPAAPAAASETLTLRRSGHQLEQMTVDNGRMFGPAIEVARYGAAYRGRAFDRIVDLRSTERLIEGSVGSGRPGPHLENYPDGFVLRGLYGGELGEIEVRADRIVGSLGTQAYDLRKSCTGESSYTSGYGPTELVVPASIMALPARDRAAVLAIFLGR